MKPYINEFFTVFGGGLNGADRVEVDIADCNSITICNITNIPMIVPFPQGVLLSNGQKFTIEGKDNEIFKGRLTVYFDTIFPPSIGQAVFIRKKYI